MKGDRSKSDYPAHCFVWIKWDDNHLSLRGLFKISLGIIFCGIWFILSSIITDKRLLSVAGDARCLRLFATSGLQTWFSNVSWIQWPLLKAICVVDLEVPLEKRGPVRRWYHITVISTKYGVKEGRDERMLCTTVSQMGMCEASDAFCETQADYSFILYQSTA